MGLLNSILGQPDNSQLSKAIVDGAYLVDVRTPEEFSEGSAKGAVNIPLDKVPDQLSEFNEKNGIVVFCRSGNRSGTAKGILEENGFQNVINGGTWNNVEKTRAEVNK